MEPLMTKKKIAIVNVFFAPQSIGGATRVVMDNVQDLAQRYGDEFELVVFTSDVEMQESPHRLDTYMYRGIRVYRSSIIFREHMDWHAEDAEMYDLFADFLAFEKPDLIHFHCVQRLSASILEAALVCKIPYVVTVHDAWWISDFQFLVDKNNKVYPYGHITPITQDALLNNMTLEMSTKRLKNLKRLLNSAESIVTVSDSFQKIYQKNGIRNIGVTKNGISKAIGWDKKDTSYTDKVVCAHIGGMSPHKGYDLLQEAITKMQPKNIEMLVVDHSQPTGYEKKDMWGNVPVRFIGSVKQEDIVSLYQSIDVLFAPSIWPESFGLVTREAAACGCWVVASNMGGIGEDVIDGETGFVIEPTQDALELVIETIDNNCEYYKGVAPVTDVRYVNSQVDELVDIYKEVIS